MVLEHYPSFSQGPFSRLLPFATTPVLFSVRSAWLRFSAKAPRISFFFALRLFFDKTCSCARPHVVDCSSMTHLPFCA